MYRSDIPSRQSSQRQTSLPREDVEAKLEAESVESILSKGEGRDPERFPLRTEGVPAARSILAISRDSMRDLGLPRDGGEVARLRLARDVVGGGGLGGRPGGGVALRTWLVILNRT